MLKNIVFVLVSVFLGQTFSVYAKEKSTSHVIDVKDVETLNDDIEKYAGKRVRVEGEVEDKLDSRSFLLESGGILNDQIIVLTSPKAKNINVNSLDDDKKFRVTGTVVTKPLANLRKEYAWDISEDRVRDLRHARAYLVADEISPVEQ